MNDGMRDLLWSEVKRLFDPEEMGALPDAYVPGASIQDWQAVLDLIRSSGWAWDYSEGFSAKEMPSAAEVLPRPPDADNVMLRVRPIPDVEVIFRLEIVEEIDFEFDLRELQGQVGVDRLCDFLCTIGRLLGKQVLMCPEFSSRVPILGFDPDADRVVLLVDP